MKLKEVYDINITAVDRIDADCKNNIAKYSEYKEDLLDLLDDTGMAILHTGTDLFLSSLASHSIGHTKEYVKRWFVRMGLWTSTKIEIEQNADGGYTYRYIVVHRSGNPRRNILVVQYSFDKTAIAINYFTKL